jgi:tetratricopeptide (TPR) repeat protein
VALAPDSFRGYSNLGPAYFMQNRIEDAVSAFERSLAIRPNYPAASNLGTLYYFQGQYRRSADAFRAALSLNDGNYQVWLNLADALFWANDLEGSKETYRQARARAEQRAKINQQDAFAQLALAFCNAALGEKDKAMDLVRNVIRLAPRDPQTLFQLAVFLSIAPDSVTKLSPGYQRLLNAARPGTK